MGFTPINEDAVDRLIAAIPGRREVRRNALLVVEKILHRCQRHPGFYQGQALDRGQFPYGEKALGDACYLTYQEIRTVLKKLEEVGFLTIQATKQGSTGTVLNFSTYVNDQIKTNDLSNGQLTDKQRSTNDPPKGTKANGKSSTPLPSSPLLNVGEEKLLLLKFPEQPDAHTLTTLKPMPFHYDPETRIWTAVESPQARDVFEKMIDLYGPEIAYECTPDQAPALIAQLTAKEPA